MMLLEGQLALPTFQLFLLADVLADLSFVQPHRAHTVASRPKMQARHAPLLQEFAVNPHSALPLQDSPRVGHTILRGDAQAHVNVVRPTVPLHQLHALLPTPLPQNRTTLPFQPPVQHFLSVLGNDHNVVLAFPAHMGQGLPFVQRFLLPVLRDLPGGRT
jgi:hypothetical protein